jgi:ketosteroid isomerase-like protein
MKTFLVLFSSLLFLLSDQAVCSIEVKKNTKDPSEIISRLEQWPKDFNDKKVQAVCDLFAPNLVASYPGTTDKNYEEMCLQLKKAMTDVTKQFRYAAPHIEEILIGDNMAAVRLIWTLTISNKDGVETVKEKGLDVFQRQPDGKWKIAISFAYPI